MRLYPCQDPYIYQEEPVIWNLYCRKRTLNWYRRPQEKKHSINIHRDLDLVHVDFVFNKDLRVKNWKTPRRRRNTCLSIYYGSGIERPKYNYDYMQFKKLLEILEKQKGPPKKSNWPSQMYRRVKRER